MKKKKSKNFHLIKLNSNELEAEKVSSSAPGSETTDMDFKHYLESLLNDVVLHSKDLIDGNHSAQKKKKRKKENSIAEIQACYIF